MIFLPNSGITPGLFLATFLNQSMFYDSGSWVQSGSVLFLVAVPVCEAQAVHSMK